MAKATTGTIELESISPSRIRIAVEGTSDLVQCKLPRSFELQEIFKQSHPKGTKIPAVYCQPYNLFERLITGIHWLNPIPFHDEDNSLYTEEEWERYMKENKPCILSNAWLGVMERAVISCGIKDAIGKNATDFKNTVSCAPLTPIDFAQAGYDQHLAPAKVMGKPVNVLTQQNVFTGWSAKVELSFLHTVFPAETLVAILDAAGKSIGVGSRRREGYGRFKVVSVEEL